MFHGGSGGGGGATCMSLPLGKYFRRALRGSGRNKPRLKDKEYARQRSSSSLSVELMPASSSSSSASASWTTSAAASWSSSASASSSVVRVVLWSGMVEVYAGVVLACTVIRRHPPGLCLAHTDVFRNPHRATLRPLEPLFPGQKFFLLPETTVRKLQRDIPLDVGSPAAVPFPQAISEEEEEETSTEVSPSRSRSWSYSEEERPRPAAAAGAAPEVCCARDYFENRERWAESQFKMMVERGIAAAEETQSSSSLSSPSSRRSAGDRADRKRRRKTRQHRRDLLGAGAAPPSSTSRAWEPSLPPVQEEAAPSSPEPQSTSSEARTTDHETR